MLWVWFCLGMTMIHIAQQIKKWKKWKVINVDRIDQAIDWLRVVQLVRWIKILMPFLHFSFCTIFFFRKGFLPILGSETDFGRDLRTLKARVLDLSRFLLLPCVTASSATDPSQFLFVRALGVSCYQILIFSLL